MEPWRRAFRVGFLPQFSTEALEAIQTALETDDPRLVQGKTVIPPPFVCSEYWPAEAACISGWNGALACGGFGEGGALVADVEEAFARMCHEADQRLEEPAGCRWFLNQFDAWCREDMIAHVLPEVVRELELRRERERPRKKRGFACLNPEQLREVSSRGGKNVKNRHRFTSALAAEAGRKGGQKAHALGKAHQFTSEEARAAQAKARHRRKVVTA